MLSLSVGQTVVHPTHGTGKLIDITQMDLVDGYQRYYVIEFLSKRLTLHIPIRQTADSGLRQMMGEEKVDEVLDILSIPPYGLSDQYKSRRKQIEDLMKTGRPSKIAEVVRELTWRKEHARLSKRDSQILSQARDLLIKEITLVTDQPFDEVRDQIDEALADAVNTKQEELAQVH